MSETKNSVIDDINAQKMKYHQSELRKFKYWLRINGYRLNQFGTGEKWNPIKIKSNIKSKEL